MDTFRVEVSSPTCVPADPTGPSNPSLTGVAPILGLDGQFHAPALMVPPDRVPDVPEQSKLERATSTSYDLDDAASTCVNFDERSMIGGEVGGELVDGEESWGQWKDDEASTSSTEEQTDLLDIQEPIIDEIQLAESAATSDPIETVVTGMQHVDSDIIAKQLQQLGEEMVNSLEDDDNDKPALSITSDQGSETMSTTPQNMKRPFQPTDGLPLTVENVEHTTDDTRLKMPRLSSNWSTCATMGDDDDKSQQDEAASLRVNTSRSSLIPDESDPTPEPSMSEQMDQDPEDPGILINVPQI